MSTRQIGLPQSALDLLILRDLGLGPQHGCTEAERVQQMPSEVLRTLQGSLYPALHRLQRRTWAEAKWGTSDDNGRAKYPKPTRIGTLEAETESWERLTAAVGRVLKAV